MYLGICYSRMSDQKNAATEYEAFIKACPGHPMAARVQTLLGESRASKPH
jgi:TolA-binding protein